MDQALSASRVAIWIALSILALPSTASAQNPVLFSPDITVSLGTGPVTVDDDDAASDDGAGIVSIPPYLAPMFSAIPDSAQISDFELSGALSVGWVLSTDTTAALPGLPASSPAEPSDVVRFDSGTGNYSTLFDGSANGIPAGVAIDASATDPSDRLLLSFDTTVALPGGTTADDEDVVSFASGTYSMVYDGSAHGVAANLDVDAAHWLRGTNLLLLSFDGSGEVGGVAFDDEDVVAYDTVADTYSMYHDGSGSDPDDWPAADLVALPEPSRTHSLGLGALLLAALIGVRPRSASGPGSSPCRSARPSSAACRRRWWRGRRDWVARTRARSSGP